MSFGGNITFSSTTSTTKDSLQRQTVLYDLTSLRRREVADALWASLGLHSILLREEGPPPVGLTSSVAASVVSVEGDRGGGETTGVVFVVELHKALLRGANPQE